MKLKEVKIASEQINCEDLFDIARETSDDFNNIVNGIVLFGKNVYFSNYMIEELNQDFWHMGSLERKNASYGSQYYNIKPCNNTVFNNKCSNCNTHTFGIKVRNKMRDKCVYRMATIHWFKDIIDKANNEDDAIKVWSVVEVHDRQPQDILYLRYKEKDIDYLILLKDGRESYYFISAFPVFEHKEKKELDASCAKNK